MRQDSDKMPQSRGRPRVTLLVQSVRPGGRRDTVEALMDGLKDRFEVECWSLEAGPGNGVASRVFNHQGGLSLKLLSRLTRALEEVRPALVHTHGTLAHFYGILAAGRAKVPARVVTIHRGDKSQESRLLDRLRNRIAFRRADRIVAISTDQLDHLQAAYRIRPGQWRLIPVGIDLAPFLAIPDLSSMRSASARVITAVGHLRPEKNHELIIDAYGQIAEAYPDTVLRIAGEGTRERTALLAKRARDVGVEDRVEFLGIRRDVDTLLGETYMFVHAAHYEALGRSLIEAGAAARPAVAARVGGIPDVVRHEETGILCDAGSCDAFAGAMARLLDDAELATGMGAAARKWVSSRFSREHMISEYTGLYSELLEAKGL